MTMITIPKHYIYAADNSHTQRDDEIAAQRQGIIIRRFEYDCCQLMPQGRMNGVTSRLDVLRLPIQRLDVIHERSRSNLAHSLC